MPIMVIEKNISIFVNKEVPWVSFLYYSLCVLPLKALSVYKVCGEEIDLSVITARPSRQSAGAAK